LKIVLVKSHVITLIKKDLSPNQKNFQLIQVLRGVACILVALMHITVTFSEIYQLPFFWDIFKFGGSGVDIFFVLSGFVITYSNRQYLTKATNIGNFLKKRAIRIFPIYWIIISFLLLLQLLLPSFYRTHFQINPANLVSTYLLFPNHEMINGVSWSLSNELFFYILFGLAIVIPQKKYSFLLLLLYFIVLLLLPLMSIAATRGNDFAGLFIFPMNIEFLLGIAVVLLVDKFPQKWTTAVLLTGTGFFILSAVFSNNGLFFLNNGYNRVLMFGFPAFLIILALVKYESTVTINVNKLFMQLGDASYSIYLFHLPIVVAFFKIMAKLPVTSYLLLTFFSCILFFAICFIGIIIYNKIERPLIKWINSKIA
jgi:exopolysaccharide production protein ExoZ